MIFSKLGGERGSNSIGVIRAPFLLVVNLGSPVYLLYGRQCAEDVFYGFRFEDAPADEFRDLGDDGIAESSNSVHPMGKTPCTIRTRRGSVAHHPDP
jgi:hypothetical protein